jgi:hypothetical protein
VNKNQTKMDFSVFNWFERHSEKASHTSMGYENSDKQFLGILKTTTTKKSRQNLERKYFIHTTASNKKSDGAHLFL